MINETWFESGAHPVFKKPNPVKFQLAQSPGVIETLEGPISYWTGAYIMTGPHGEQYPITAEKFDILYDIKSDGYAIPKKIIKLAKTADHSGAIVTPWGSMEYNTKIDIIVRHGESDYGVVKAEIFAKTYDLSR